MPTFAYTSFSQNKKKKKKSRSGRKIGAVGDDKQLIFFTWPYVRISVSCQFGDLGLQVSTLDYENIKILPAALITMFFICHVVLNSISGLH